MANYNAISSVSGMFKTTTSIPLIGAVVNSEIPSSVISAVNKSTAQLLPGDPVVLNVSQNKGAGLDVNSGYNYNNALITKKATTTQTGIGTTSTGGFLCVSSSDVALEQGNVPVPREGVLTQVARLGSGAQMWLEVASQNLAQFQASNLDINTSITIDTANGGVKVATAGGTDFLVGARIKSGVANCQKITMDNGVAKVVPCTGILVEFN